MSVISPVRSRYREAVPIVLHGINLTNANIGLYYSIYKHNNKPGFILLF